MQIPNRIYDSVVVEEIDTMLDDRSLLEKHSPILVIFPQCSSLPRPGSRGKPGKSWGDYHPCNVEFFLDNVTYRSRPRKYSWFRAIRGLFRGRVEPPSVPNRIDDIRARVGSAHSISTRDWELDLATIPSQHDLDAWDNYGSLRREANDEPARVKFEPTVYGRVVPGRNSCRALQYWYFYCYNDFANNHEGDWEQATIELNQDGQPVRVGYSAHVGGFRRLWANTRRDRDQPLLYVSRGSHAGRFCFKPTGFELRSMRVQKNLPWYMAGPMIDWTSAMWIRLLGTVGRTRDRVPADPDPQSGDKIPDGLEQAQHQGVRLYPKLQILPNTPQTESDSRLWWLNFQGRWGSWHSRVSGSLAPPSPWASERSEWIDPLYWIDCKCDEEQ